GAAVQTSFAQTDAVSEPTQMIQRQSGGTGTGPTASLGMTVVTVAGANTGDLRIQSAASIDQTGGKVVANNLGARAVTGISLTSSTNDADTVGLSNTTSGGISYRDVDGFTVGSVAAQLLGATVQTSFAQTDGVSAPTQMIQLQSGGTGTGPTTSLVMTLLNDVSATTGDVRMQSAASIDQTGGKVVANNLGA